MYKHKQTKTGWAVRNNIQYLAKSIKHKKKKKKRICSLFMFNECYFKSLLDLLVK